MLKIQSIPGSKVKWEQLKIEELIRKLTLFIEKWDRQKGQTADGNPNNTPNPFSEKIPKLIKTTHPPYQRFVLNRVEIQRRCFPIEVFQ